MPLANARPTERLAQFSPDGRYVAYESWELGVPQIFVRTFPDGAGKWQISNDGGRAPRWSADGGELFYLDDGAFMAVRVETEPVFRTVGTQKLFEGPYLDTSRSYDVTSDGKRFLMIRESEPSSDSGLVVVLDWFEELKRLVPND